MGAILGCIADDFTGATDLAGLLARSGAAVSLRIGAPDAPSSGEPPGDAAAIEVIALKSRTAPAAEAVRDCRAALAWLRAAGAERFYWKYCSTFDSTPTGNIGPVAEALMDDIGAAQTIYCPAFPENGRTVFMGTLFVGRRPLAESPMKDHPLTPMRDSNLMRLLAPQVARPVGLIDRLTVARGADAVAEALAALRADGIAHVVVDAVADADLETIARGARGLSLLTGGSALAAPLPKLLQEEARIDASARAFERPAVDARALVLSGSCSAMTRKQVAQMRESGAPAFQLDPMTLATDGARPAIAWLAEQAEGATPLVYATAEPEAVRAAQERLGVAAAGAMVESALAEIAVAARDRGVRRFIVAGGESSGAVAQALGVERLAVGAEIAPGAPWTFAESDGHAVALALKSGNFGRESFFADALAALS